MAHSLPFCVDLHKVDKIDGFRLTVAADAYMAQGYSAKEASETAVKSMIKDLQAERAEVAKTAGIDDVVVPEKPKKVVVPDDETPAKVEVTGDKDKTVEVDISAEEEEALTPKEQKKYLLAEIDAAISEAKEFKDGDTVIKFAKMPRRTKKEIKERNEAAAGAKGRYEYLKDKYGEVTIEVPNDGTFTILNIKSVLNDFKVRAKKFSPNILKPKTIKTSHRRKRVTDFIGEYKQDYKPYPQSIINGKNASDSGRQWFKDGWFMTGSYFVKTNKKPKVSGIIETKNVPEIKGIIEEGSKNLTEVKPDHVLYINPNEDSTEKPRVVFVFDGKEILYTAQIIDAITTIHPDATMHIGGKPSHSEAPMLILKNKNEIVGLLMPVRAGSYTMKNGEIDKDVFNVEPKKATPDETSQIDDVKQWIAETAEEEPTNGVDAGLLFIQRVRQFAELTDEQIQELFLRSEFKETNSRIKAAFKKGAGNKEITEEARVFAATVRERLGKKPIKGITDETSQVKEAEGIFVSETTGRIISTKKKTGKPKWPKVVSNRRRRYLSHTTHIKNSGDAAAFADYNLSKFPQERLVALLLGEDGKILGAHRFSVGVTNAAPTHLGLMAGQALNTEGVREIVLVHNHPAGSAELSDADIITADAFNNLMSGTQINTGTIIAVADGKFSANDKIVHDIPKLGKGTNRIPMLVRQFKTQGESLPKIRWSTDVEDIGKKFIPEGGLLFLNNAHAVVGTMRIDDYSELRGKNATEILKQTEKTNATVMVAFNPKKDKRKIGIVNLKKFSNASRIALLDVVTEEGSLHETSAMPGTLDTIYYETSQEAKTKAKPLTREAIETAFAKMKNVTTGQNRNDTFWFRFKGFPKYTILEMDSINDRVGLTDKRQQRTGAFVPGKSQIWFKTGGEGVKADIGSVFHEQFHMFKNFGVVSKPDIRAIHRAIRKNGQRGKITEEMEATFIGDAAKERAYTRATTIGRILQKLRDFVDVMVNLVKATSRGVVRKMETGAMADQGVEAGKQSGGVPAMAFEMMGGKRQLPKKINKAVSLKEGSSFDDHYEIWDKYASAMERRRPDSVLDSDRFSNYLEDYAKVFKYKNSYIIGQEKNGVFKPSHFAPNSMREGLEAIKELGKYNNIVFAVTSDLSSMLEQSGYYISSDVTMPSFFAGKIENKIIATSTPELLSEVKYAIQEFKKTGETPAGVLNLIAEQKEDDLYIEQDAIEGGIKYEMAGEKAIGADKGALDISVDQNRKPLSRKEIIEGLKNQDNNLASYLDSEGKPNWTDRPITEKMALKLEHEGEIVYVHLEDIWVHSSMVDPKTKLLLDEHVKDSIQYETKDVDLSEEITGEDSAFQQAIDVVSAHWGKQGEFSNERKKLKFIEHHLGTTMYNAKRIGGWYNRFYNVIRNLGQYKYEQQERLRSEKDASLFAPLEKFKKKNKSEYRKVKNYLVDYDIYKKGYKVRPTLDQSSAMYEGAYDIIDDKGTVIDTFTTEDKAVDQMWSLEADKTGFSDAGKDAILNFRKMTRNLYKQYASNIKEIIEMARISGQPVPETTTVKNGEVTKVSLKIALQEMGDRQGYYFPRIRNTGEWKIEGTKSGMPTQMKTFASKALSKGYAQELERKGYTVSKDHAGAFSEDLFQTLAPLLAQEQVINSVIDKVSKNEDFDAVYADMFIKKYAEMLKSHGSRARMIGRSDAWGDDVKRGYETDPVVAIAIATEAAAGGYSKQQIAINAMKAITGRDLSWAQYKTDNPGKEYNDYLKEINKRGADASRQQTEFKEATVTLKDILKNQELADRIIGTLKGMAVVWYLGGRVSSAAVNITNMVMGVPATIVGELSGKGGKISFKSAFKNIGKAMASYGSFRAGKSKNAGEIALFQEIEKRGWDAAQLNMEALNVLQNKYGNAWSWVMEKSMWMFGVTEKINRATSIAAGYMALCKANKVKLRDVNGELHEKFLLKARNASDLAHGVYEKGNRPYHMRGDHIGANVLQMTYVFQTFTHNYLQEMTRLGLVKKQYGAALYMALSGGMLGGLGATIPVVVAKAIAGLFDTDDPEEEMIKWIDDAIGGGTLARYGLPGLLGVSLKGSLATRIEVPETTLDWFGAPGSVVADIWDGIKNLTKGYYREGFEKLAPVAIGNLSRGLRESTEGASTRSGSPVFFGNERIKGNSYDALLRWLSFNPTNISEKREIQWNEFKIIERYKNKRSELYERYKRFYSKPPGKRNEKDMVDIVCDIRDFKIEIERKGISRIVKPITKRSIKQSLRSLTPSKRERER